MIEPNALIKGELQNTGNVPYIQNHGRNKFLDLTDQLWIIFLYSKNYKQQYMCII